MKKILFALLATFAIGSITSMTPPKSMTTNSVDMYELYASVVDENFVPIDGALAVVSGTSNEVLAQGFAPLIKCLNDGTKYKIEGTAVGYYKNTIPTVGYHVLSGDTVDLVILKKVEE